MSEERGLEPVAAGREEAAAGAGDPADDPMEIEIVSIGDEDVAEPPLEEAGPGESRLAAELAEAKDKLLRLRADFDNYRKRTAREREEQARRALAEPILELLPVLDNLERALGVAGGGEELRQGVELTAKQFVEALRRFGLAEIPALGRRFDPQVHEAVAREESAEVAEPTVVAELGRGYWLNDRLLRPALVRVAVPAAPPLPAEEDE